MLRVTHIVLGALVAALIAFPAVASAAPADWTMVDVTVHSDQQQSVMLVSGELPEDAELPQEAELALPAGTQLQWVGQILGGDPAEDPELTYTMSTVDGMDVYRFTLTESRVAQLEGTLPATTAFDGAAYATTLEWAAWRDLPQVRISMRIPQASQIVQSDPAATLQPGDAGYGYYTKTLTDVKAGDPVELAFSYALPAAGGAAKPGAASGSVPPALIVVTLVILGGLGLFAYNVNRKMATKREDAQPAEYEDVQLEAFSASAEEHADGEPLAAAAAEGEGEVEVEFEADPATDPAAAKRLKPTYVMAGVIAVMLAGFAIAGLTGTSANNVGGTLTRDYGGVSPCQSGSFTLVPNDGVDLASEGERLVNAFEGMESIGVVTLDVEQAKIDVSWCESSQSPDTIQDALTATGLVTLAP